MTSFPIADGVDGNGFDPATGLAFASSGTGVLTIAHEDAPNKFTVVQTLKTQPSGRTMWLDAVTHNVYVPVAMTTTGPNGRAQITPNTMKILVFGLSRQPGDDPEVGSRGAIPRWDPEVIPRCDPEVR